VRVAVATLQYGRHEHLQRQSAAVRELPGIDRYLVVSMDEDPPAIAAAEVVGLATGEPAPTVSVTSAVNAIQIQ